MHTAPSPVSIQSLGRGRFLLRTQMLLAQPIERVFAFFADAANLQRITPPWLHFSILTPTPIPMHAGARIDYRIKLHGIPIRWKTRITAWDPPRHFIDEQISGPYRQWHHEHFFEPRGHATWAADQVTYHPLGGSLINKLFVQRDVVRIFEYRRRIMLQLFGEGAAD